jgi:hypothetical protein
VLDDILDDATRIADTSNTATASNILNSDALPCHNLQLHSDAQKIGSSVQHRRADEEQHDTESRKLLPLTIAELLSSKTQLPQSFSRTPNHFNEEDIIDKVHIAEIQDASDTASTTPKHKEPHTTHHNHETGDTGNFRSKKRKSLPRSQTSLYPKRRVHRRNIQIPPPSVRRRGY